MMYKTQVFNTNKGNYFRNWFPPYFESSSNFRVQCKALKLNDELVEAFALGHDLGNIPLDHGGEEPWIKYY